MTPISPELLALAARVAEARRRNAKPARRVTVVAAESEVPEGHAPLAEAARASGLSVPAIHKRAADGRVAVVKVAGRPHVGRRSGVYYRLADLRPPRRGVGSRKGVA